MMSLPNYEAFLHADAQIIKSNLEEITSTY